MPSSMPRRGRRRSPPPPPPSDASPLPVPSPPPPSPSAASSRATSPLPPAAASTAGRTPPLRCPQPPAEASTSRSPPLPYSPPPGAASTSHPPSLPCSPPPAAASRATSPPLPSTTSRPPPLLSPPPPAAACTSRPPPLHDPTPSPSLHHQPQPPPECRYFDGDGELFADKDGEGLSYSRPQPPPCEDTERAVRIEALSPPNPFPSVSALMPTGLLIKYFLRVDADGLFHTYPHRGGPFKSLEEAQEAIDTYHANRIKIKYLGELSKEDRYVWHKLYWRDGTRKNSKEALDAMMNLDPTLEVVKCLLDKHNEEHHLFEKED
uniref:Uncharacterized protein n=1 Tax=Triticum urartu TaxID=4572 RepID=A0A8R7Q5E8_TRIUA